MSNHGDDTVDESKQADGDPHERNKGQASAEETIEVSGEQQQKTEGDASSEESVQVDDLPLLFISHKHKAKDKEIASTIKEQLLDWAQKKIRVVQTSDESNGDIGVGASINKARC